jgi:hypothetical protein
MFALFLVFFALWVYKFCFIGCKHDENLITITDFSFRCGCIYSSCIHNWQTGLLVTRLLLPSSHYTICAARNLILSMHLFGRHHAEDAHVPRFPHRTRDLHRCNTSVVDRPEPWRTFVITNSADLNLFVNKGNKRMDCSVTHGTPRSGGGYWVGNGARTKKKDLFGEVPTRPLLGLEGDSLLLIAGTFCVC